MDKKRYAGVAVKHEGKVLFCKRNSKGSYPGMWSIPGGSMEEGESPESTARREFYEEMGVDIDGEKLNFVGLIPRFTRDGKKLKGAMYVYQLDADKPIIPDLNNAIDGEEHTECGYYGLDEMTSDKVGEYLHKLIEVVLQ